MIYFKNVELAEKYHVSLGTVRNWIRAAAENKLALTLHTEGERMFIANTSSNLAVIEQLVSKGKKYRNTKAAKEVAPRAEFYKLYNQAQIYDIVNNLETHHEVPRQYNYFGGGANNWDRYSQKLASEVTPNVLTRTIELLGDNRSYLDKLLASYKRVNVVDIGPGNAFPARDLLGHLLDQKKLGRYIAVDISSVMIEIARRNIGQWFNHKVPFEGFQADITHERFGSLLAEEYLQDGNETISLILFLGGRRVNKKKTDGAFETINDSMNRHDLLVYTDKLDSEASRNYFDFNPGADASRLAPNHRFIFDLLNIDESFYDVERGFDQRRGHRYIRVRLKVALRINFSFDIGEHSVELEKGETILLWRAWEVSAQDIIDQQERTDFHVLQASQSEDQGYILTVSRVKAE